MIRTQFKTHSAAARTDVDATDIPQMLAECRANRAMLWIDLQDDTASVNAKDGVDAAVDTAMKHVLREVFQFDALAVDDALAETHVPRVDDWSEYLYVVLHAVAFKSEIEDIDTRELDAFLGRNFLVTYHYEDIPELDQAWRQTQRDERLWRRGADYLFYTLSDAIATGYMPCMDAIDGVSDELLDSVFDKPSPAHIERIFHVKRAVLKLRRILAPQREVMSKLAREGFSVIDAKNRVYFRDVYDHFVRMADLNESLRDIVAGSLDTYLSVTANRTNDVMKVLTVVTVLFAPLTFITGFFGMNFFGEAVALPGASAGWLIFGVALGFMLAAPLGMWYFIRRRRWL